MLGLPVSGSWARSNTTRSVQLYKLQLGEELPLQGRILFCWVLTRAGSHARCDCNLQTNQAAWDYGTSVNLPGMRIYRHENDEETFFSSHL